MKKDRRRYRPYIEVNYGWTEKAWRRLQAHVINGTKSRCVRKRRWGLIKYKGVLHRHFRDRYNSLNNRIPF